VSIVAKPVHFSVVNNRCLVLSSCIDVFVGLV
jgi:hypothetical protein